MSVPDELRRYVPRTDLYDSLELVHYHMPVEQPPATASYIIFKKGNKTYAKNGTYGHIEYEDTDSTTVIQNAVNALTNGGKIFIKRGTYTGDGTNLTITKDKINIIGEGRDLVIFDNLPIKIDGSSVLYNIVISSLTLKGAGTGTALYATNTKNALFDNLRIYNWNYGIFGECTSSKSFYRTTIRKSWIHDTDYCVYFKGVKGVNLANHNYIVECDFGGNLVGKGTTNGIYIAYGQGNHIIRTHFGNINDAAIRVPEASACNYVTVRDCWFESITSIFLNDGSEGILTIREFDGNMIGSGITIFNNILPKGTISQHIHAGSRSNPLEPNNDPVEGNVLWCKIPDGTALTAGRNTFYFYAKWLVPETSIIVVPFADYPNDGTGGISTPYTIEARSYMSWAAYRIRVDVIVDADVTLSSDLLFKLILKG